jgi:uncharacterized membrane protein
MREPWQTGKPPNEVIVEVEHPETGKILLVRAMWGRDGYLPHWESQDRSTVWAPNAFRRWRHTRPLWAKVVLGED